MTTATVRYIQNGFTVNWSGSQAIGVPASIYAVSIPEAVYWLARIFDPVADPGPPPAATTIIAPTIIVNDDPLLGQEAEVVDIATGGFVAKQRPNFTNNAVKQVEVYCVDMDAVAGILNLIFAPPTP